MSKVTFGLSGGHAYGPLSTMPFIRQPGNLEIMHVEVVTDLISSFIVVLALTYAVKKRVCVFAVTCA